MSVSRKESSADPSIVDEISPSKGDFMAAANLAPIPELFVSFDSAAKLKHQAGELLSWDLTARQVCDLDLLMNGGFNPLKGFMTEADYNGVVTEMRLADGSLSVSSYALTSDEWLQHFFSSIIRFTKPLIEP